ncbi:MAG: nickel pincer cofactor biosynthesis protein LarC [Coriobacteriia bacterium]|nr:nickel pincer cofactor biosynthesis protein LarC [Coriobacteriia bacterium]
MFAYLDCFSGISGDKFLGALVGAGLSVEMLKERLALLDVDGYELFVHPTRKAGLAGTQVEVILEPGQRSRDWKGIRALIEHSGLDAASRAGALRAFGVLAEAEAEVHGTTPDDVHFHEVGAVDSIVDIVGAAIGIAELGIDELWCTPVRLGSGTVMTSHGELPVPAPATAALLRGMPTYAGELAGEMTTPTGAALLRAFVTRFAPMPPVRVHSEGWGAGTWDLPIPNLLRLSLAEREMGGGPLSEVVVLESAIDHVTPELLAAALDIVLEEGALDAWAEPLQMKKRRLGTEVTVITRPADAERLTELLMLHTGTLGVRRTATWRQVAPRRVETVATSLGMVRVKVQGSGDSMRVRPENDDVVAVARSSGMPLDRVMRVLTEDAEAALRSREP